MAPATLDMGCLARCAWTSDAVYADCIENAAYNGMLGAVNSENVKNYISGFPFDSYSPLLFGMRGKASSGHRVIKKDGVISDHEMTVKMLQALFRQASSSSLFTPKPRVVICVPSGVTEVEERTVINAAIDAGAKAVKESVIPEI